jgi:hypothetical protein
MIFMSTISTTICRGALQRKSNVAVTFTDAQSDSSFVVVHHMLGRANMTGQAGSLRCRCLAYAASRSWSIGTNTVSLRNGRFVTKSRTQPRQQQMSTFAAEQ